MRRALPLVLAALASMPGCGLGTASSTTSDDWVVVPEGKEDNYFSTTAQEFTARADAQVKLDDADAMLDDAARLAKAKELVSARLLQIGWFLNLWVADKEPDDANKSYGGYHAMARNSSVKSLSINPVDQLTYSFNFEATIAAQNKFMTVLPGTAEAGGKRVDLKMAKLSNEQLLDGSWQSDYDVHSWDPAKDDASKVDSLSTLVVPAPRSSNAYLDYDKLYADGKLLVGAQFGWDYNDGRADLANSRQLYNDLVGLGFHSPVEKYEDLKLDSPPLSRSSTVNGQTVQVEVKIVHPGMVQDPAANAIDLRNALLDLLATREVVLFNGHAGVSGRLLPADFRNASAGNIMPEEYPTLKLYDGFQILLVEGCQTYARFTDGFRQNPAKRGPTGELVNMDIVTSTSYTWTNQGANAMESILFPLIGRDATQNVEPSTWNDVLKDMNARPNQTAFMGVNGIDEDPHAHPYARADLLGRTCTTSDECGGAGNVCARATSGKACATVCLDDAGCPSGYRCASIASGSTVATKACVAR
jgi:hypothetical protein